MSQMAVRNNILLREAHAVAYATCGVLLRNTEQKGILEHAGRRDMTPLDTSSYNRTRRNRDTLPVSKYSLHSKPEERRGDRRKRRASILVRGSKKLDIIVANLPDGDEVPSKISAEELIESQMYDNFSKEIKSAFDRAEAVRFRDNHDTGFLERISP
eukprot:IDg8955t1